MKAHPLADLLPEMSSAELRQLADDIQANGLRQPIVEYQHQILDGRHRFKACQMVDVEPRFVPFSGDDAGAAALVISSNLARRQLTKSQLAMAGAKIKEWYAAQAKARQIEANRSRQKKPQGIESKGVPVPANSPERENGDARDQAAKAVGVGAKLIDQAESVMKKAVPEVKRLVENGDMTLNEASKIAALPKATQQRIAAAPTRTVRQGFVRSSITKSNAGKKVVAKASRIVQPPDAPGTALVRTLLSRLELLTNEIERTGLTPQQFAERFVAEFDWSEPLLVKRLGYTGKAVEMVATLSVISQRAHRESA